MAASEPPESIKQSMSQSLQGYLVQLPVFQGPLDLLLHLIEREELDITKVALAQVTDQYLAYLTILKEVEAELLTDFLVIAAKLVFIKSQALLPRPPDSLVDQEEEDVGDQLARQLRVYKQFKTVAEMLRGREAGGLRSFIRLATPPKPEPRLAPGEVSLADLLVAARHALAVRSVDPAVSEIVSPIIITISQKIALIRREITRHGQISFSQLLRRATSRMEIIVTFLAVLELIKQRRIDVRQESLFSDILIYALTPTSASDVRA